MGGGARGRHLAMAKSIISAAFRWIEQDALLSPLDLSRSGTRWLRRHGKALLAAFSCAHVKSRGMISSVTHESKYRVAPQKKTCMTSMVVSITTSLRMYSEAKKGEKMPVSVLNLARAVFVEIVRRCSTSAMTLSWVRGCIPLQCAACFTTSARLLLGRYEQGQLPVHLHLPHGLRADTEPAYGPIAAGARPGLGGHHGGRVQSSEFIRAYQGGVDLEQILTGWVQPGR